MSIPTVAIIGRPNVGKSTLFNRIIGRRQAIVDAQPGVTRDRHFAPAEWNGRRFWLVDTGGLVPGSADPINRAIRAQVEQAVADSDVLLFVVDIEAGIHPLDRHTELRLKLTPLLELGKPVCRRCEEQIADLLEPRGAELLEEGDRFPGEAHLSRGGELLSHSAHRLAGRTGRDL